MTDTTYLNCDGCRGTIGPAGCPTHRGSATYIDPSHSWSSSTPVLTHCQHGLDLRIHPRCYLCKPAAPADGLRESAERVVGRFLDTPASLAGVHVAALNDLRAALTPEDDHE